MNLQNYGCGRWISGQHGRMRQLAFSATTSSCIFQLSPMSRRTAIVEDFDDDTDLPLPSRPLPNTGAKGPLLQEIDSDSDDLETGNEPTAGPATTSQFQPRPPTQVQNEAQFQSINELHPDHKSYVHFV
jgi:hypothetical protein